MPIAVRVQVDTSGFDRMIRALPKETDKAVRAALSRTIGPRFRRRVRAKTRVDTGRLKRSVFQRAVPGETAIDIGYNTPYARYIERMDNVLGEVADAERDTIREALARAVKSAAKRVSRR